ncbi:MAG: NAD-dependent epimerase/dehydratase family protein [Coriobacteriales bacterium]|jgi:nucleoside-diphosphate-sugar epimerase|nr:NAD-dependent epimerase/dehydratase family protein [Coriobacteriales bacterium]
MSNPKNILVLGGSYFVGRVFNMLASQAGNLEMFVVNRGRYTLGKPHVTEFKCERHDTKRLVELLPPIDFDALIDLCAYEPGDISLILDALGTRAGHYIDISTSSVYAPNPHSAKTEAAPLATGLGDDPASQYVAKKLGLEGELTAACEARGVPWTIFRPAFIFGPYNYAPRESWFVEKIVRGEPVPVPTDAAARFSFVYVSDVARALMAAAGDGRAFGRALNLAGPEELDYPRYLAELARCNGGPFATEEFTVAQVLEQNIPLPFPLTAAETDLTSGELAATTLNLAYTPFSEGMEKAFTAFRNVYAEH